MVRVVFPSHLHGYTGGEAEVEVEAGNVRELLNVLEHRFPGCREVLSRSAMAVDGEIYQDAYLEPLPAGAEVFFMQRIEGG